MSTRIIHRPARLHRVIAPEKPVDIAPVPVIRNNSGGGGVMRALLPVAAGLGMILMMFSSGNPIRMAVGVLMLVVVLLTAIGAVVRAKTGTRKQAEDDRKQFLEHLDSAEDEIRTRASDQRHQATLRNPSPEQLTEVVRQPHRLWERRSSDEDFLVVRIGRGTGDLACGVEVRPTSDPMAIAEPIAQAHLDRMLRRTRTIEDLPIAVPLHGTVSVIGSPQLSAEAVRGMLLQAAVLHAPDDLRFHLALPLSAGADNGQWALWLPHLLDENHFDGPIGMRGVSFDEESSEALFEELDARADELREQGRHRNAPVDRPHLLVVLDMGTAYGEAVLAKIQSVGELKRARVSVIATSPRQHLEPSHVDVRLTVTDERQFTMELLDRGTVREPKDGEEGFPQRLLYGGRTGTLDHVSPAVADSVARELSPLRLVEDALPEAPLEKTISLDRMLGIDDFGTYDIQAMWQPRATDAFLNVPFAVDADGTPVHLDIKESAKNGMGPHGLCVGATGSGKSEVLRTIVLGQAVSHPPDQLSLVLVDYKGGATFAGLESLPHTAGIVDNLEDGAGLVDRLHDSIEGEIQRRQRVLADAGNLANVAEYNRLRDEGKVTEPLPVLFVVIDEFGELLAAKPEFIDLFVQIGRIGRSIGVHLLLASQRLEEGRLRGLESYLSYRLGLRTFSAAESRTAIGTPDAHELPPIPGSGLLKVDPDIFDRFKAAYVSGEYVAAGAKKARELPDVPMPLELANTTETWLSEYTAMHRVAQAERNPALASEDSTQTTLDLVVGRLSTAAPQTRQIWLAPLKERLGLEEVTGPAKRTVSGGLGVERSRYLSVPLGMKDEPKTQWQGPMTVNLSGSGGNMVIIGAPQAGKSTVLRTFISSLALTHTPREVNVYVADMAGSSLGYLADLPHIGDVASRFETEKLSRMIAEVRGWLEQRERVFLAHRIDDVEQMRQMHREGQLPDFACADLFLVIDGWTTFKKEFEELANSVQDIAQRGLGYGIHVVISTVRWADFRLPMQNALATKVELAINDAIDSQVGRKPMESLKEAPVGRALTMDKLQSQIALPTLNQSDVVSEPTSQSLVRAIADAWPSAGAPAVRMLPQMVTYEDIRRRDASVSPVVVGLAETDLGPVRFDLDRDQRHVVIFGDSGSGKTSTLRTFINEILRGARSGQVMFGIVDTRRSLLGYVPDSVSEYAGTLDRAKTLVEAIRRECERRLPPSDVTPEQLRNRSWWSGPEIYVVVDDFDMIEGTSNPLKPLAPYLPQAADIGLHVIVARRSAGAGRASYEGFMQGLKDAGANALLLSGERSEGKLWHGEYMRHFPAGRAQWVDRAGKNSLVQLGYTAGER